MMKSGIAPTNAQGEFRFFYGFYFWAVPPAQ